MKRSQKLVTKLDNLRIKEYLTQDKYFADYKQKERLLVRLDIQILNGYTDIAKAFILEGAKTEADLLYSSTTEIGSDTIFDCMRSILEGLEKGILTINDL